MRSLAGVLRIRSLWLIAPRGKGGSSRVNPPRRHEASNWYALGAEKSTGNRVPNRSNPLFGRWQPCACPPAYKKEEQRRFDILDAHYDLSGAPRGTRGVLEPQGPHQECDQKSMPACRASPRAPARSAEAASRLQGHRGLCQSGSSQLGKSS